MEHFFDETKGDLKYILEEQRRKEENGTGHEAVTVIPKKKNGFSRFFKRLKNLLIKNKLISSGLSKDDRNVICYILCFITS
ncbi:MAG: hypothetical protein ABL872_09310 [Lacibacter sp.]